MKIHIPAFTITITDNAPVGPTPTPAPVDPNAVQIIAQYRASLGRDPDANELASDLESARINGIYVVLAQILQRAGG
jgi:hypothetical protein